MRILIIKTSSFGDIVQSLPVAAALKKNIENCQIDWVVESRCAELIQSVPTVSNVIIADTRRWKKRPFSRKTWNEVRSVVRKLRLTEYDLVIDLQGNVKSSLIALFVHADKKLGFGFKSAPEWIHPLFMDSHINPSAQLPQVEQYLEFARAVTKTTCIVEPTVLESDLAEREMIEEYLGTLPNKPKVMVAFGTAQMSKTLSTDQWIDLLQKIRAKTDCYFIINYGTPKEHQEAQVIQQALKNASSAIGCLPIATWQYLMTRTEALLCVDSFALHLASLAGVHTFSLFGPSSAKNYAPSGPMHMSIQGKCPYLITFQKRCPNLRSCPTSACTKEMNLRQVANQFALFLEKIESKDSLEAHAKT